MTSGCSHHCRAVAACLVVAVSCLFSSCYFNSAAYIFDEASYEAAVDITDLKPQHYIYVDNDKYYLELPRYKAGNPVKIQYSLDDDKKKKKSVAHAEDGTEAEKKNNAPETTPESEEETRFEKLKGKTTVIRIPADYARYLMGQVKEPTVPEFAETIRPLKAKSILAQCKRVPVACIPEKYVHYFRYTSPNAPFYYVAGVLWTCSVDGMVTFCENMFYFGYKTLKIASRFSM